MMIKSWYNLTLPGRFWNSWPGPIMAPPIVGIRRDSWGRNASIPESVDQEDGFEHNYYCIVAERTETRYFQYSCSPTSAS